MDIDKFKQLTKKLIHQYSLLKAIEKIGIWGSFASILSVAIWFYGTVTENPKKINEPLEYRTAKNYVEKFDVDNAIKYLKKALEKNPEHKESIELLGEELLISSRFNEAENLLSSKKHALSSNGIIMLMLLRQNAGKYQELLLLSNKVQPSKASAKWVQYYYSIKSRALGELGAFDGLKKFISSSIEEINTRLINIEPRAKRNNPYSLEQKSETIVPVDLLMLSSAKYYLASMGMLYLSPNEINKIKHINASFSEYGFGVSSKGQFVTTPQLVQAMVKKVMTNYNKNKDLSWNDVSQTYKWLLTNQESLKGVHVLTMTVGKVTLSISTGASAGVNNFISRVLKSFKEHYKLDDLGKRIIT